MTNRDEVRLATLRRVVSPTEISPRGSAALLYAALNWPVVPLHTPDVNGVCDCPKRANCESVGKHPRTMHGLADATCDTTKILRWWQMWPHANVAIDLARSNLVDIAPDSLDWFAQFVGWGLPSTLTFASGGGEGHHHYLYARPEGCAVHRDCQTGKYDLLSNGYAVMPPSLHRSGRLYTWENPADGVLTTGPHEPAPAWSVNMLSPRSRAPIAPLNGTPTAYHDFGSPVELHGEALERWYGRLVDTKPDGTIDRSRSLWALAVDLLAAGCSNSFTEVLLAERDRELGWTKFSDRGDATMRYHVIVERAREGQGVGPVRLKEKAPAAARPAQPLRAAQWLTAAELSQTQDELITWFAYGLLGAGLITELDGKVKQSGKTTLVLAMLRAILLRQPFFGRDTVYTPVVYLAEQSGTSFKRNLDRAGLLEREDLHILLFSEVATWDWPQRVAEAIAKCEQIGARVLVVDTLSQFSSVRGDNENSSGAAMEVMEPLQVAADKGIAMLLNRHDRKSGGDTGDSARGSSAYAGAVDIILHLMRVPGAQPGHERERLLEGLSRLEETPDKLLIQLSQDQPYEYAALGDPGEVKEASLRAELLRVLPLHGGDGLSAEELEDIVSTRAIEVLRALRLLMAEHLVRRVGAGKKGDPYRYFAPSGDTDD